MQIVIAILALSILIIVHELGHFTVAKLTGIKVLEFSLFMGPQLVSIKKGETVYSVRLIPLGGFVRMEGEEEASEDDRAFNRQPLKARAAVIAAGPAMNLLVAFIIILALNITLGYRTAVIDKIDPTSPAYEAGIRPGDRIVSYDNKAIYHPNDIYLMLFGSKGKPVNITVRRGDSEVPLRLVPEVFEKNRYILGYVPKTAYGPGWNEVASVNTDSQAYAAGLRQGDRILKLNGRDVTSHRDIRSILKENKGKPIAVTIERGGAEIPLTITPVRDNNEEQYELGAVSFVAEKGGIIKSVSYSASYAFSISRNVYYSLAWLVSGRISPAQLSGPVGIVASIGDVVQMSPTVTDKLLNLLSLMAFISINLGLFNLIPFPALDGSKLILLGLEAIRKKAIPPEKEALISLVGFVLLIMLMLFTTYNDIIRRVTGG
jgi:regulator of sigma E protease